ncbi:uncharacterized protein F5Z01DRAFT_343387 [Emericellopsis atlantica]|uniref:Uncharacterized protein n=1 Tax=Emericellopsis atlantica TaxID=2614577 RepID=A0A9P7ZEY1_9HYPO|nr:uncharacterized protein F5Z01DRAFT_343387 [Emericellopsis atlantica]KAG9250839.1 hypothetical protein F5Z01DRAFT_343387 [Emericellopsis atlantica]
MHCDSRSRARVGPPTSARCRHRLLVLATCSRQSSFTLDLGLFPHTTTACREDVRKSPPVLRHGTLSSVFLQQRVAALFGPSERRMEARTPGCRHHARCSPSPKDRPRSGSSTLSSLDFTWRLALWRATSRHGSICRGTWYKAEAGDYTNRPRSAQNFSCLL